MDTTMSTMTPPFTNTITAYCWASGLIEFGHTVPEGAIEIVTGDEELVRATVKDKAQQGYAGELLVPSLSDYEGAELKKIFLGAFKRKMVHIVHQPRTPWPNGGDA